MGSASQARDKSGMDTFWTSFGDAFRLIASGDAELWAIVGLSLQVSLTAVAIAVLVGLPLGALLAVSRFPGRRVLVVAVNTMMGLPPVVVGLFVYLMLSRSGPLGVLQLLYTPTAMIIAQTLLIAPIVAALTRQLVADLLARHGEQLRIMGASRRQIAATLLWEGRRGLLTVALAGFGRAIAEVGAVMIVGANIRHVTQVMTTAIAQETSEGNFGLALGLGAVLLLLALAVNAAVAALGSRPDPQLRAAAPERAHG